MSKLLLINSVTYREGVNNIGDVVGAWEDDHVFTQGEIAGFDIVEVKGITPEEFWAKLYRPAKKEMWQARDGSWKEKAKDAKYSASLNGLNEDDVAALASDDEIAKNAILIAKVKHGLELISENLQTEITKTVDTNITADVATESPVLTKGKLSGNIV